MNSTQVQYADFFASCLNQINNPKPKKSIPKELSDILMLIRDAVGELDQYSAYNDDELNEEVYQLLEIIRKAEAKYDKKG